MSRQQRRDEQATVRMDAALKQQIIAAAKATGMSQNAFMEEALRRHVQDITALQTEQILAPLLSEVTARTNQVIRTHGASQRKLTVRVAYEVLRLQYVVCEFLIRAGMTPGEVQTLLTDGWAWGAKVFKAQPDVADNDVGSA